MDQSQTQTPLKSNFVFPAGTGVIRSKVASELHVIYYGRMGMPGLGQCFIDGNAAPSDKELTLTVRNLDRKVVATLTLPRGQDTTREGKLRENKRGGKTWKVVATIRATGDAYRMALRMPDVKIAQPAAF